jgi:hypothetical protein
MERIPAFKTSSEASPLTRKHEVWLRLASYSVGLAPPSAGRDVLKAVPKAVN